MGIIKEPEKKKYIIESINDNWIRIYLLNNDKKQFIGAGNPKKLLNYLTQYYYDWPEGKKCIIVFSETHTFLYGKRINDKETEILLQDKNTNIILEKVISKDTLHESIAEIYEYIKGIKSKISNTK